MSETNLTEAVSTSSTETPVVEKVKKVKVAKVAVVKQPKIKATVVSSSLVIPRKECKSCVNIAKDGDKRYVCSHAKRKGGKAYISMKHILGDRWNKEGTFVLTEKADDVNTDAFKSCPLLKA